MTAPLNAPAPVEAPIDAPALALGQPQPRWTIGAGVGLVDLGGASGLGFSTTGGLERRIFDRSWLLLDVRGAAHMNSLAIDDDAHSASRAFSGGLSLGWRQVHGDDDDAVRPSAHVALTADGARAISDKGTGIHMDHAVAVGATVGGAVDVALTEVLFVRFAVDVLRASAGFQVDNVVDGGPHLYADAVALSAGLTPQLQLRAFF